MAHLETRPDPLGRLSRPARRFLSRRLNAWEEFARRRLNEFDFKRVAEMQPIDGYGYVVQPWSRDLDAR